MRRRVPKAMSIVSAVDFACGSLTLGLAAAHLLAVSGLAVFRALTGEGAYDLRLYWLLLLGTANAIPGFLCARSARGLTQGDLQFWKIALWCSLFLLMVNLPLAPLNGFGTPLAVFASVNILSLAAARRQFA